MNQLGSRLFYIVGWVTIVASLMVMLTGLWWKVGPHQGLVMMTTPPMITATDTVEVGKVLTYTVKYCVDESLPLPITVDRVLEFQTAAGEPVSWPVAPPISYQIRERCETKVRLLGVPSFIPIGRYHIQSSTSIQVNPLRVIKQEWTSNDFLIVPRAEIERAALKAAAGLLLTAEDAAKTVTDTASATKAAMKK